MGELLVYTPKKVAGEALCRLLWRRQFQPQYFQYAEELQNKLRFGYNGVVILDLSSVPTIDEDLEHILSLAEELPVIMVTPYASDEEELERFQQKGYHFMEKPLCVTELVKLLHSLVL